jgi:2-phosphosulfolactate phosphatase
MRIDVAFTPADLAGCEVAGRTVFVIDVLRASTTICAALASGARGIIPVASIEEAMKLAQTLERGDVLLAGERNSVRIDGFDLGNSPLEVTEPVVRGKTMIMTTTNGTRALLATGGAGEVFVACGVNLSAAGAMARSKLEGQQDLLFLCAGREGCFAFEDAYAAGRLILAALEGRRTRKGLNDAALVSVDLARRYGTGWFLPLKRSRAGRELVRLGFHEDVRLASEQDRHHVVPRFFDRRVTLGPGEAGPP